MRDVDVWVGLAQRVQNGLVHDLAGEAHIGWLHPVGGVTHQSTAPVRGRAGNMRDAVFAGAGEEGCDTFARLRQDHRAATDQGAEQNLQAAIAADVVERAPHCIMGHAQAVIDRACQGCQRVHQHFGPAGGAGGEQHPFGAGVSDMRLAGARDGQAAIMQRQSGGLRAGVIGECQLRLRVGDDERQVRGCQVRRAEDDAARDAVQFKGGERRGPLLFRENEHRLVPARIKIKIYGCAAVEFGKFHGSISVGDNAPGRQSGGGDKVPQRCSVRQKLPRTER